jgi:hypothetical protein
MYQPAIPVSGYSGWKFLQSTYSRQLENFADTATVKNDRDYLTSKLSEPISKEDFLDDRRLLRIAMTSFDLGGEEWKRGYIDKVLEEVNDPDSTFLARLNNTAYTAFAETFAPNEDEMISLSEAQLSVLADNYETAAFKLAVGEVDGNMRLSLNYQSRIADIVGTASSDNAILYRMLGDVPIRTVLEGALNLPSEFSKLDLDQQAGILKDKLSSQLGINDLQTLTDPARIDRMLERFHVMETVRNGTVDSLTPGATALTLLGVTIIVLRRPATADPKAERV